MRIDRVPAHVLDVLRRTDRRLSLPTTGPMDRYQTIYYAMAALAPGVDSFYVGTCVPGEQVVDMGYAMERGRVLDGDLVPYGPDGLTARLIRTARPYCFSDDDGALLRRGLRFGDREEQSQDAIVAPMVWQGRTEGMVGFLSYTTDAFTEVHVWAAQWLADACIAAIKSEEARVRSSLDLDRIYARTQQASPYERLKAIEAELVEVIGVADDSIRPALDQVLAKVQSLRADQAHAVLPAEALTEREAEVLDLVLRRHASNQQIAEELGVTVRTVKAHMTSILRKHGVTRRADLLNRISG
ncbi:LuxR C-terminal-related transcriptional regulator [Dermacoccaceae bacterium W4C1]